MSSVFKYIKEFYNKEFNLFYFLLIIIFLGVIIYLNYWHFLERKLVATGKTKWSNFIGYYFLYLFPFALAFILQLFFYKDCSYFNSNWFWAILLIAPAIFSFRVNANFQENIIAKFFTGEEFLFWRRCINWVVRVFLVLIPIYIIWFLKDKNIQPFYGVSNLKSVYPYLIMLLIMVPLIAIASMQKDFLSMYPKVKFINGLTIQNQKWRYVVYELCYGFDFVSIEFFFRGFLILSLAKICGTHCIIPIACFYCTIHLGKPIAEAISSFWGGLLLGILCFNTGSILGGLIVHLGIAWFMEVGGWLGALLKR